MEEIKTNIRIYTKCTYTIIDNIHNMNYKYGEFREGLDLEECYIIAGGNTGLVFTPKNLHSIKKNFISVYIDTEDEFLRLLVLSTDNEEDYVAEVCAYAVKKNIHKFIKLVKQRIGVKLQQPEFEIRKGRALINFEDELLPYLGNTLVRTMFTSVKLYLWGGRYIEKEGRIWYNPNLHYTHPEGGSNGVKFVWSSLCFDLKKNKWIEQGIIMNNK